MFAITILNYVNYEETIGAIKNLSQQTWFNQINLYIADNGSPNDSIFYLEKLQKEISFKLVKSQENLGYARGANLAIKEAVKDGCKFVIELNSDARINGNQDNFLKILENIYNENNDIALITPDIINSEGISRNPMDRYEFSFLKKILLKIFFYSGAYKIYFFLRVYFLYSFANWIVNKRHKKELLSKFNKTPESGYIYAALGSCQVMTPTYFRYFSGHTEEVFLYCEEYIKAEHLKSHGLKTWFDNRIQILHKESKTVEMITDSHRMKIKFLLTHMFKSCKVFVKMLKLFK